jgi:L-fuculose-phosphate aldolase
MKTETDYRHDIVEIGKRIYAKGFVAANDGNFSIRISDDEVIITPTGMSKGYLTPDQLIKVNMSGERREGYLKPSSELPFHLKVYEIRPDVKAVVHAHPPISTAFAVAGIPLDDMILPEAIISLGCVPLAKYGTPGTDELVETVSETIRGCDAILMANHGALTVGPDIYTAYYKMETMEHFAYIDWIATTLGQVHQLREEELRKLLELRKRFGSDKPIYSMCPVLSALQTDEKPSVPAISMSEQELTELIARVTASVLKEL